MDIDRKSGRGGDTYIFRMDSNEHKIFSGCVQAALRVISRDRSGSLTNESGIKAIGDEFKSCANQGVHTHELSDAQVGAFGGALILASADSAEASKARWLKGRYASKFKASWGASS